MSVLELPRCKHGHLMTRQNISSRGTCLLCHALVERRRYRRLHPPRTVCKNGLHELTPENIVPGTQGRCLACRRARGKRSYQAIKADQARWADFLEACRIRKEGERRRAGVPAKQWSAEQLAKRTGGEGKHGGRTVDPEPFLRWLGEWLFYHPEVTLESIAVRAGSSARTVRAARERRVARVRLELVDRFLVATGESPALLDHLYPLIEEDQADDRHRQAA